MRRRVASFYALPLLLALLSIAKGDCTVAPLRLTRDVVAGEDPALVEWQTWPKWSAGVLYTVTLTVSDIRTAASGCPAPASVEVEETVPSGWLPRDASDGGVIVGGTIGWTLTGPALTAGKRLTYRVASVAPPGRADFAGMVDDEPAASPSPIEGESRLENPTTFSSEGFLQRWLLLGPYRLGSGGGAPPAAAMGLDYLCDGAGITQLNVQPAAGEAVNTTFNAPIGCAASTGLEPTGTTSLNPGAVPTWHAWQDADDTIDLTTVCQSDEDNVLFHAAAYIDVAADATLDIGLASDDSVQVILDGVPIWTHSIARVDGGPNTVQDVIRSADVPQLNPLAAGRHVLLVKVFEGSAAHTFRLRFQDPVTGHPVTAGITACIERDLVPCSAADAGALYLPGDANADGELSLADAFAITGYLFLGLTGPICPEAADADGNGHLLLTDTVRVLNFLFLGGPPPAGHGACRRALEPCSYPISPCGSTPRTLARPPEEDLRLELSAPGLVDATSSPGTVPVSVRLRNTDPANLAVQGWSLSLRASPASTCAISAVLFEGTEAAGLFQGGFTKSELVDRPGSKGAVSSVILSFTELRALPGDTLPHELLRLDATGSFPAAGCEPCVLDFVDGLQGSGEPVSNLAAIPAPGGPRGVRPLSRPATIEFCAAVTPLVPDGPAHATVLPAGESTRLFVLSPRPAPGSVITLNLDAAARDEVALYVRWGAAPSFTELDHAADRAGRSDQRLVVPYALDQDCYVLVHRRSAAELPLQATLSAETSRLALEAVSVECPPGGCSGVLHLAARGGRFTAATRFALVPRLGPEMAPLDVARISDERVELTFDAGAEGAGLHDLVARDPGGGTPVMATLLAALRLREDGETAALQIALEAPAYYRPGRVRRATLRFTNSGSRELPAPLFEVSGPPGTLLGLAADGGLRPGQLPELGRPSPPAALVPGPLQVLGIHAAGIAGWLPPGATGEIAILFRHPDPFVDPQSPDARLELRVRRLGEAPPVRWEDLSPPPGIPEAEWPGLRSAIAARHGDDYAAALGSIASRLTRRGESGRSVAALVGFALGEAGGAPSSVVLGTARGPGGAPIAQRRVAALSGGQILACAPTDPWGAFALGPLPAGAHELAIEGFAMTAAPVLVDGTSDELAVHLQASAEDGSALSCPVPAAEPQAPAVPPGLPRERLEEVAAAAIRPAVSEDPNTKDGPDAALFVVPGEALRYTISFENQAGVSAAANRVVVIDLLDVEVDPGTIRFTDALVAGAHHLELGTAGGLERATGYGAGSGQARFAVAGSRPVALGYPEDLGRPVELLAGVTGRLIASPDDVRDLTRLLFGDYVDPCALPPSSCPRDRGQLGLGEELCELRQALGGGERQALVWILEGLTPETFSNDPGDLYGDDRIGLFPPNDATGRGEGHVGFEIAVRGNAESGEIVENRASIVFDTNCSFRTEPVENPILAPRRRFVRGDCNGDAQVNISDPIFLTGYAFNGEREPPCLAACDADGKEGFQAITDAIAIASALFLCDCPLPPPGPPCGPGTDFDHEVTGCAEEVECASE